MKGKLLIIVFSIVYLTSFTSCEEILLDDTKINISNRTSYDIQAIFLEKEIIIANEKSEEIVDVSEGTYNINFTIKQSGWTGGFENFIVKEHKTTNFTIEKNQFNEIVMTADYPR